MGKMPNEEMERLGRLPYAEFTNRDKATLWQEAERARASEAEKDEIIKALADASAKTLATLKAWHKDKGEWAECQDALACALRLVGRLP